ncbi:Opi1-domain-containing protein [Patellaria atrata CBS 101060]|uniref:Opi1-domain-containing protein n=1 Tax=Patellaria atrata CBS 101060 TaxID=1346257 RepID=A0A9P4VTB7_9PEZI|nr:Opi1-domain-containing protein [Patellaria atrata CBS 101060]
MSLQQELPPAYTSHDPASLDLPSVPRQEVPSANTSIHLPDLRSLGLPQSTRPRGQSSTSDQGHNGFSLQPRMDSQQWSPASSLHHNSFPKVPATALRHPSDAEVTSPSTIDAESVISNDEINLRAASVVSMDDPDVRMAAEALSGLGNPDFIRSPSAHSTTLPLHSRMSSASVRDRQMQEPEPLLQLLTSSHPWLGGTINGSLSAYSSTKSYSPRFIQYGAEFVERNIGSPVANTVGAVGRRTGVEGGLRRYLGSRRRSDMERSEGENLEDQAHGNKRRRVFATDSDPMDIEKGLQTPPSRGRSRGDSQISMESLPAYDDQRSPKYEEHAITISSTEASEGARAVHSWPTQLMITTSGLGAALNDGSLRSLKYCLKILRSATTHITELMHALRLVLDDWERTTRPSHADQEQSDSTSKGPPCYQLSAEQEEHARIIAERMKTLSDDIWTTIKAVVNSVSRYTGGALPENAGDLVRRQLMSVPNRWRVASASTAATESSDSPETVGRAHKTLAFAKEGLDMISQVSLVVDGTIVKAEQWLDSLGKRRGEQQAIEAQDKKREGLKLAPIANLGPDIKNEKTGS